MIHENAIKFRIYLNNSFWSISVLDFLFIFLFLMCKTIIQIGGLVKEMNAMI